MIVDLRDKHEYNNFHIQEATNVPGMMIHQNRLTNDILEFKNKPNCLIVLYHEFEKDGISFTTILTERGFDNVYM